MARKTISATELSQDIRSEMTNQEILKKYEIPNEDKLFLFIDKLICNGRLEKSDKDKRIKIYICPTCGDIQYKAILKCPECRTNLSNNNPDPGKKTNELLEECKACGNNISVNAKVCPKCGEPQYKVNKIIEPLENDKEKPVAKINKKSGTTGNGCAFQFFGVTSILLAYVTVFSIIGPFIFMPLGVWLIYQGFKRKRWFECSECGTHLSNNKVRLCPGCKISLYL